MRYADAGTVAALQSAFDNGIRARDLVTFSVRGLDGTGSYEFSFWGDLDPTTIGVVDPSTGAVVDRVYQGDGGLIKMDAIPLTSDLTVRNVTVTLSQIHETVQDMVRGYDCRGAKVQIHRAIFDPQTNALVGNPQPQFMGKVDKAPISTPAIGSEGSIAVACVSATRELTRTNPAKRSDETQKRRSGDRFRRWNSPAQVEVWWGQERSAKK